jgi:putative ABC transport system substrate-binding protein
MRRFLVGFLVAVLAAMNADAQTPDRIMRIGVMQPGDMTAERERYQQAFRDELRSRGWTEGRNLVLEYHSTFGKAEQLPELAVSVVNTRPDGWATLAR